jgi:hypothetical protein
MPPKTERERRTLRTDCAVTRSAVFTQGELLGQVACRLWKFRRIFSLLTSKHRPSRIKKTRHVKEGLGGRETATRDGNGRKWKACDADGKKMGRADVHVQITKHPRGCAGCLEQWIWIWHLITAGRDPTPAMATRLYGGRTPGSSCFFACCYCY